MVATNFINKDLNNLSTLTLSIAISFQIAGCPIPTHVDCLEWVMTHFFQYAQSNPGFRSALLAAAARRDYDSILCQIEGHVLSMSPKALPSAIAPTSSRSQFLGSVLRLLHEQWNSEYRGPAITALRDQIEAYESLDGSVWDNRYYAKIIPVIQSSGMGKSRLIDQLSKEHVGLSYVLRSNGESGYPPGDVEVTRFLLSFPHNDIVDAHSRMLALLQASLTQLNEWVSAVLTKTPNLTSSALAQLWHDEMAPVAAAELPNTGQVSEIIACVRSKYRQRFCATTVRVASKIAQELNNDEQWRSFFETKVFLYPIQRLSNSYSALK